MYNYKGGVSKTTSTISLATVLAMNGKRVLMIDGDPQCNLTSFFASAPAPGGTQPPRSSKMTAEFEKHKMKSPPDALEAQRRVIAAVSLHAVNHPQSPLLFDRPRPMPPSTTPASCNSHPLEPDHQSLHSILDVAFEKPLSLANSEFELQRIRLASELSTSPETVHLYLLPGSNRLVDIESRFQDCTSDILSRHPSTMDVSSQRLGLFRRLV